MRLTRKSAIEWCIKHWTWVSEEEGRGKWGWPELPESVGGCFFCYYDYLRHKANDLYATDCKYCPYHKKFGHCAEEGKSYDLHRAAFRAYQFDKAQQYAKDFLAQLKTLQIR